MSRIVSARLRNQRLRGARFATPVDAVSWLGAVQAQEYDNAKWALALRTQRTSDAAIEHALTEGTILRTHVLRPTWHFVAAADIRWMLALTGPRISAAMASYNRQLELDAGVLRRSQQTMVRALRGGVHLTRQELKAVLQRDGINADGVQRLAHIVMQAELDGVICSGVRRGRQITYALLDERVAASPTLSRDDALAELARRYFTSHGPAQLHDFAWWSGLTVPDARTGIGMVEREFEKEIVDGKTYWLRPSREGTARSRTVYLLPLYDEYLIAYKDRSAALDISRWTRGVGRDPFSAPIVVDGRVVGGWKRIPKGNRVVLTLTPFEPLDRNCTSAIEAVARTYARFIGLELELSWA